MKYRPAALLCTIALTCAAMAPAHAVSQVSQTTLTSDAKRLISYRHQRHLFVTSDGRSHLVANLSGQSGSTAALNLQSSNDGLVWIQQRKLGYTDSNSVSDSALNGNVLTVVYQCSDGLVRLATASGVAGGFLAVSSPDSSSCFLPWALLPEAALSPSSTSSTNTRGSMFSKCSAWLSSSTMAT